MHVVIAIYLLESINISTAIHLFILSLLYTIS